MASNWSQETINSIDYKTCEFNLSEAGAYMIVDYNDCVIIRQSDNVIMNGSSTKASCELETGISYIMAYETSDEGFVPACPYLIK